MFEKVQVSSSPMLVGSKRYEHIKHLGEGQVKNCKVEKMGSL